MQPRAQALTESGYDVYALDLPGYGRSEGKVDAVLKEVFLKGIIAKLKLKRPVIVSPSMSGSFSIPLILKVRRAARGAGGRRWQWDWRVRARWRSAAVVAAPHNRLCAGRAAVAWCSASSIEQRAAWPT